MNYKIKDMNDAIEKWLKRELVKAPDQDYARLFFQKNLDKTIKLLRKPESIFKTKTFKSAYLNYRKGNFGLVNYHFHSETAIVGLLTVKQREILLFEEVIGIAPASELKKWVPFKNSEALKSKKDRIYKTPNILPESQLINEKFIINDKSLIKEVFKAYKIFIFYLELKRKLKEKAFIEKLKVPTSIKNKIEVAKSDVTVMDKIPENKYPAIFINGYAFKMFSKLKTLTVKKRTEWADCCFIFHSMRKKHFIITDVKQSTFIAFLNTKCGTEITSTKLPFKDQQFKKPTYEALLKKYESLINGLP